MDPSPSSDLINTDLSPASLPFPKTALGIVESYPAAQMMFFSTASIHMYCSGNGNLLHGKHPAPCCRAALAAPFLLEVLLFGMGEL